MPAPQAARILLPRSGRRTGTWRGVRRASQLRVRAWREKNKARWRRTRRHDPALGEARCPDPPTTGRAVVSEVERVATTSALEEAKLAESEGEWADDAEFAIAVGKRHRSNTCPSLIWRPGSMSEHPRAGSRSSGWVDLTKTDPTNSRTAEAMAGQASDLPVTRYGRYGRAGAVTGVTARQKERKKRREAAPLRPPWMGGRPNVERRISEGHVVQRPRSDRRSTGPLSRRHGTTRAPVNPGWPRTPPAAWPS